MEKRGLDLTLAFVARSNKKKVVTQNERERRGER